MIHRLLGVTARLGERLAHIRINFVPLHWVAMFGLGALCAFATTQAREAMVNGKASRPVDVAAVLLHQDTAHNFVTVKDQASRRALLVTA